MSVREVLRYPAGLLKHPSRPAGTVGSAERTLAQDLLDTMRASPACVGLAAPQIGEAVRAFVLDVSGHRHATTASGTVVMFDPDVVEASGRDLVREGCLSVPDLTANVERATMITVSGLGLDGEAFTLETEGFEARAFLHEIDHLDGLLILDRVASASDLFKRRRYA